MKKYPGLAFLLIFSSQVCAGSETAAMHPKALAPQAVTATANLDRHPLVENDSIEAWCKAALRDTLAIFSDIGGDGGSYAGAYLTPYCSKQEVGIRYLHGRKEIVARLLKESNLSVVLVEPSGAKWTLDVVPARSGVFLGEFLGKLEDEPHAVALLPGYATRIDTSGALQGRWEQKETDASFPKQFVVKAPKGQVWAKQIYTLDVMKGPAASKVKFSLYANNVTRCESTGYLFQNPRDRHDFEVLVLGRRNRYEDEDIEELQNRQGICLLRLTESNSKLKVGFTSDEPGALATNNSCHSICNGEDSVPSGAIWDFHRTSQAQLHESKRGK